MENILLRNTRIFSKLLRVEISVKIFIYGSAHPNIYRKGFKVGKCKQRCTRSDLFAYAFDFCQLRDGVAIRAFGDDVFKVYLSGAHLFGGIHKVFIAEARVRRLQKLGRSTNVLRLRE